MLMNFKVADLMVCWKVVVTVSNLCRFGNMIVFLSYMSYTN